MGLEFERRVAERGVDGMNRATIVRTWVWAFLALLVLPPALRAEVLRFGYTGICNVNCNFAGMEVGESLSGDFIIDENSIPVGVDVRVNVDEVLSVSFVYGNQIFETADIPTEQSDEITFDNDGQGGIVVKSGVGSLAENGSANLLINPNDQMFMFVGPNLVQASGAWLVPEPHGMQCTVAAILTLGLLRRRRGGMARPRRVPSL